MSRNGCAVIGEEWFAVHLVGDEDPRVRVGGEREGQGADEGQIATVDVGEHRVEVVGAAVGAGEADVDAVARPVGPGRAPR